jgi:hypothetical protein
MSQAPPDDDLTHTSGSLEDVRAWGERRDRTAKAEKQRADEAEQRAARYREEAVKGAARDVGLNDEQLTVILGMSPNIEPEQIAEFAKAFGMQAQPPTTEGAPPEPTVEQPSAPAPPSAPLVSTVASGVAPQGYSTRDFIAAAQRGDDALLDRMATEVASGARGLVLLHPEAQPD